MSEGRSRNQIPGPSFPEGARGLSLLYMFFVFLGRFIIRRVYKVTLSDKPPSHCATESQSFRFNGNFVRAGRPYGGGMKKCSLRGLSWLSEAVATASDAVPACFR